MKQIVRACMLALSVADGESARALRLVTWEFEADRARHARHAGRWRPALFHTGQVLSGSLTFETTAHGPHQTRLARLGTTIGSGHRPARGLSRSASTPFAARAVHARGLGEPRRVSSCRPVRRRTRSAQRHARSSDVRLRGGASERPLPVCSSIAARSAPPGASSTGRSDSDRRRLRSRSTLIPFDLDAFLAGRARPTRVST